MIALAWFFYSLYLKQTLVLLPMTSTQVKQNCFFHLISDYKQLGGPGI